MQSSQPLVSHSHSLWSFKYIFRDSNVFRWYNILSISYQPNPIANIQKTLNYAQSITYFFGELHHAGGMYVWWVNVVIEVDQLRRLMLSGGVWTPLLVRIYVTYHVIQAAFLFQRAAR